MRSLTYPLVFSAVFGLATTAQAGPDSDLPRVRRGAQEPISDRAPMQHGLGDELGLAVSNIEPSMLAAFSLSGSPVVVNAVAPGSDAERAGVRPYDILVAVNDSHVDGTDGLANLLADTPLDAAVTFHVLRQGEEMQHTIAAADRQATVMLRQRLEDELQRELALAQSLERALQDAQAGQRAVREARVKTALAIKALAPKPIKLAELGVHVEPIGRQLAQTLGGPGAGVYVSHVDAGSPAGRAGLVVSDIITVWNETPISSEEHLYSLLSSENQAHAQVLEIARQKAKVVIEIPPQRPAGARDRQSLEAELAKLVQEEAVAAGHSDEARAALEAQNTLIRNIREELHALGTPSAEVAPHEVQAASATKNSSHRKVRRIRVLGREQIGPAVIGDGLMHTGYLGAQVRFSSVVLIGSVQVGLSEGDVQHATLGVGVGYRYPLARDWSLLGTAEIGAGAVQVRRDGMESTDRTVPSVRADVSGVYHDLVGGIDIALGLGWRAQEITTSQGEQTASGPDLHFGVIW